MPLSARAGRRTLVISVCPSDARIALVDGEESRAAVPTMFCMLLRKHLQSARIRSVCALPNERVLAFELEGFDELGHSETKRIYAEIMGKYSNLFLCDGGDRILGALHTTDITAKTRRIFAGAPYERPPAQDKRDALSADRAGFLALARENEGMPADRFLLTHFLAFSPLTAREVAFRALGAVDAPLDAAGAERLWTAFNALCRDIAGGRFTPSLLTGPDGRMVDFSFTPIMQYGSGYTCTDCGSFSALQNTFFAAKSAENHKKQFSADLSRTLAAARARTEKKLAAQRAELADCARMDEYRRTGDLITSNLYRLKQGDTRVTLHDYETDAEVAVTLDGRLSPSKNAQRYYKKYAKAKHAQAVLTEQIGLAERELEYLSSVQDALARAETERDFAELRQELTVAGLCGDRRAPKNGKKGGRPLPSKPLAFTLTSGRTVRVGKNNLQNDALTFGADKTDILVPRQGLPRAACRPVHRRRGADRPRLYRERDAGRLPFQGVRRRERAGRLHPRPLCQKAGRRQARVRGLRPVFHRRRPRGAARRCARAEKITSRRAPKGARPFLPQNGLRRNRLRRTDSKKRVFPVRKFPLQTIYRLRAVDWTPAAGIFTPAASGGICDAVRSPLGA